jgi:hypothetical protein
MADGIGDGEGDRLKPVATVAASVVGGGALHSGGEESMTAESTRRAPMMNLKEMVERYAALAGNFGDPVGLSSFAVNAEETQSLFSSFDEDYHISRFLHFSTSDGQTYTISGEPVTHVAIDPAIYSLL